MTQAVGARKRDLDDVVAEVYPHPNDDSGLIIANNNKNGTSFVSSTTLTGCQWGIAPRIGVAWQPGFLHNKVVVRTGGGIYYDRGELFSYFSPGYAIGTVTGGTFGVNQQLPFVNVRPTCPQTLDLKWLNGPFLDDSQRSPSPRARFCRSR